MGRISIEREIALWKGGRPLGHAGTDAFRKLIDRNAGNIEGLSCTDMEVAKNSIEMKFSLVEKSAAAGCISSARAEIARLAHAEGVDIFWTNQPGHAPEGHNEYFTTLAFPSLVSALVHANSMHIHFETGPDAALHAYRQMNALAPWFLLNSREAGAGTDRLAIMREFIREMGVLLLPQDFSSRSDYFAYMGECSRDVHRRLQDNGNLLRAKAGFWRLFDAGGMVQLTPDKVFHPARYRPDLMLENGNVSVELRAIDGIGGMGKELDVLSAATLVFDSAMGEPEITPMPLVREFYGTLSARSKAYLRADEFVREAMKDAMGSYPEAVNE
ncbi:MAG: hypothetical protein AB1324_01005 [Candidatus Micrarchaeota archaeon]